MAYINAYLQFYTAIIMSLVLIGNLMHGFRNVERSVKVFYLMLSFDVLMLVAGSLDNYLLLSYSEDKFILEALVSGISDFSYFMIIGHFTLYLDLYDRPAVYKASVWAKAAVMIGVVMGEFWFITGFTGGIYTQSADSLTPGPLYYIGQFGGYLITAIMIGIFIIRLKTLKKGESFAFVIFIAGPLLGSLLRGFFKDIILMPLMVTLTLVVIQIFVQEKKELLIKQQEIELSEIRTDLLMSRMKPHFIYNVLNTIYVLCDSSAEEAQKAIAMFSSYLRTSMVDLDSHRLIPFEDELEHVKNYLAIEKIRFGDKLETILEVETKDFMLPPLALQALVENAVRHGIEKNPYGGTISIFVKKDLKNINIIVADNGVGFEPSLELKTERKSDTRKHVGVYSASYRLKSLCNGKLLIDSKLGEGTTATIIIPIEGKENENSGSRQ